MSLGDRQRLINGEWRSKDYEALMITGKPKLIRQINSAVVLDLLREQGPLSRIQIAAMTGLSFPSVSKTLAGLLKAGLVLELGLGESSGGRRPRLLSFNAQAGYAVGVEIARTHTRVGLTDLMGNMLHSLSLASLSSRQAEDAEDELERIIHTVLDTTKTPIDKLVGIGIGVPGVVEPESGVVHWVPGLNWREVPMGAALGERLGVPVVVDNDVNLALEGERWLGTARGKQNAVFVWVGDGIGAAILVDGRLYRGKDHAAGELGHWIILPDEVVGSPQGDGQLERRAAVSGVLQRWAERSGLGRVDLDHAGTLLAQLRNRVELGDETGTAILAETANWLGMTVSNVISLLNPEIVVLGGRVFDEFPSLVLSVRATLQRVVPYMSEVALSQLGERAVLLGGVHSVLHRERVSVTFLKSGGQV